MHTRIRSSAPSTSRVLGLNAFGERRPAVREELFSLRDRQRPALYAGTVRRAEKRSTASKSIDAISREVALPVDEILATARAALDRYIGHDGGDGRQAPQNLARAARSIKDVHSEGRRRPGATAGRAGLHEGSRRGAPSAQGHARSGGRQRRARTAPKAHGLLGWLKLCGRDCPRRPGGADDGPAWRLRRHPR